MTFWAATDPIPDYIQVKGPVALEAYKWALKTGETFDRLTKIVLIGQDRVGKISLRKYLRGEAEVVVKELLSSSKERSDKAQLFPGEGKKTRG